MDIRLWVSITPQPSVQRPAVTVDTTGAKIKKKFFQFKL